jgi:hypothetical protein
MKFELLKQNKNKELENIITGNKVDFINYSVNGSLKNEQSLGVGSMVLVSSNTGYYLSDTIIEILSERRDDNGDLIFVKFLTKKDTLTLVVDKK